MDTVVNDLSLPPLKPVEGGVRGAQAVEKEERSTKSKEGSGLFFKLLVFACLMATPFYLWESGTPQISDMLMLVLVFSLGGRGLHFLLHQKEGRSFLWLVAFVAYVIVVSLTWFLIYPSTDFLVFPLYYMFNTLVFASGFGAYARIGDSFLRWLAWGTATSVTLQALLTPFFGDAAIEGRETMFFNNPNQLGYYALVSSAIVLLSYRSKHITLAPALVATASSLWLASLSLSKAAILSLAVLGLITAVRNTKLVLIMAAVVAVVMFAEVGAVSNVEARLSGVGEQSDDSWEGRGYSRIGEHPEYLVFGAAEGGFERLSLPAHGRHEIHSSLATIFFSYGFVGMSLFTVFIMYVCANAGLTSALYLLPIMLYGMTHMGLREGLFWLMLAQLSLLRVRRPA